jgi:hypothetical protein
MRPDARVWRKHQRAAQKGVPTGRRTTHKVETQQFDHQAAARQLRKTGGATLRSDISDGA